MVAKDGSASEKRRVTAKEAKLDVIRKVEKGKVRVKIGQVQEPQYKPCF